MKNTSYTDEQIKWILEKATSELTWKEIATAFEKKFGVKKSWNAIRLTYKLYEGYELSQDEMIKNIRSTHSAKKVKAELAKENKAILDSLDKSEEMLESFENILKNNPIKVHKPVKFKKSKSKTERVIVMHLSDTHFQAQIDEEEMAGLNKYTSIEEARRLAFFTKEVGEFKEEYRNNTELVLVCNGDLGQGIIHDIESTPPITTQFSAMLHLLSQSISYLSTKFKKVKVICTVGNHLRMMHKSNKGRQTKEKWDNYATMLHVALKYALASHKNIEFDIPIAPFAYVDILGHKFFITHSDTILSIGYPGKSINVERAKNKINDLKEGIGHIDVVMVGHVHVDTKQILINNVTLLTNGSMSGIDPFALSIGITKSLPTQQVFEVTKEHAVGDMRSIHLNQADKMKELDKIVEPFKGKF